MVNFLKFNKFFQKNFISLYNNLSVGSCDLKNRVILASTNSKTDEINDIATDIMPGIEQFMILFYKY